MSAIRFSSLRLLGATLALAAAAVAGPSTALAGLLTDTVTVKMDIDIDLGLQTDNVVVGAGMEIQAGDGTNIGGNNLIQNEYIDLTDTSLVYRVFGGGDTVGNGWTTTGMGPGAYLLFDGLDFVGDLSRTITGVTVAVSAVDLPGGAVTTPDGHSVRLDLAGVLVLDPGGGPILGTITLTPIWSDPATVPEPGTLALLAAALAGFAGVARRTRQGRE